MNKPEKIKTQELPFCPLISQYLKKNNNIIFKKTILDQLFDFLEIEELFNSRFVCKQWDEIIKLKIPALQNENLFDTQKRKFVENDLFESEKKFSKKKVLISLLHSKNYNIIKKRASLKNMTKAKKLID
jgi:hypothetical protein